MTAAAAVSRPFALSGEQQVMQRELGSFLARQWPMSRIRELIDLPPGDRTAARGAPGDDALGIGALLVPAEHGGLGGGPVDLALVCAELGYSLYPGPLFATVAMAVGALALWATDQARGELLPKIAAGGYAATVALFEQPDAWDAAALRARADERAGQWTLTGEKTFVIDALGADLVLVVAATGAGLGLFAVEPGAAGLTITPMDALDPTRELSMVGLADTPAQLLSGDITGLVDPFLDHVNVALAAEQVGLAQRCLTMSVQYAKTRTQFGQPIGSFQAIKHKCADMLVAVETARAAVGYAAWSLAAGRPEAPAAASIAAASAADTGRKVAADTIQVHGGMGFTWECDAHLFYKRATADEVLFGDSGYHYRRLADQLGMVTR